MISNINLKKAFSLLEISLVVLIVGILISGVSLGVDLYNDFRLATARNLTINSRVGRIQDLVSWYEATNQNVFSRGSSAFEDLNNVEENQTINRWKDSNPKSFIKFDAIQTSSGSQPKIIFDNITSLPIVRFDSGKFLNLPNGTIPYGNQLYTVIFVSKIDADCACPVITSGVFNFSAKTCNYFEYTSNYRIHNKLPSAGSVTPYYSVSANKFQIYSFVYNQDTITIYVNKNYGTHSSNPLAPIDNRQTSNFIGKGGRGGAPYLIGSIAEIIIFNRNLLNSEREDIENYLSKKWSIKLGSI